MAKVHKTHGSTMATPDIERALRTAGLWDKFSALPPSHRKEYVQWIEDAKKPETRARRIKKMCEMINEKYN